MGVRSTCLHFDGERLSCLQCHPHLSLNLIQRVWTVFQLLLLGLFLDRPYKLNLKEMNLL